MSTEVKKNGPGRPAGTVSGPIASRLPTKIQGIAEELIAIRTRIDLWAGKETNEKFKGLLEDIGIALGGMGQELIDNVSEVLADLNKKGWKPATTTTSTTKAATTFEKDMQVWIKPDQIEDYEAMGYDSKAFDNLKVVNVVKKSVVVANGKVRFPVQMNHLTTLDPEVVEDAS